ncbi:MAG TPA: DUF2934 domain-containing protein [Blastocatellia bacterium]|nr:DUF2934 domain-containing protein [Blastocatellia bacterium]
MDRESLEQLRERLLGDERVRSMIEMRAYEVYEQRGGAPGDEAADWFQAESEILVLLIEEQSKRAEEAQPGVAEPSPATPPGLESAVRVKSITRRKPKASGDDGEKESKKKKKGQSEKSKKPGGSKAKRKKDKGE